MSRSFRVAAVLLAFVVLGACGSDNNANSAASSSSSKAPASTASSAPPPTKIVVQAGINDPANKSITIDQFMPASITVATGTEVTWTWDGAIEPHSVTFLAPGQQLPPPGDESVFGPVPPAGPYDGTAFVNSGLQPLGPQTPPPFTLTFAKAGTYQYHCVIHPQMVGTVVVVDAGQQADTPQAVADRGAKERQQWIDEGEQAAKTFLATPASSTTNPDGTRTWRVEMGTSTPHTDVLAFQPVLDLRAGDRVTFVNNSAAPHTATFSGSNPPITNPTDPKTAAPAPGPSPVTLDATGFFNSGLVPPDAPPGAGPPEAARSFTFVVPSAGQYGFYCILHLPSGMAGTLKVS